MGAHAKSLNTRGHTPDFIRPDLSRPLCDRKGTLQSVFPLYPSYMAYGESNMRHAEKLLEISEIWNIHFQSPGRLIRLLQLGAGGYLLINPPQSPCKGNHFLHLREEGDLLISHGAASPRHDVPRGWRAPTLPCCLNSQKVKWQSEGRYSRCVKISPN